MIRVYMVDDHALVRAGYRGILRDCTDIEIVGECSDGETAVAEVRKLKPDVVLCDLHMPGFSGLEVTERIVKGNSGARVVMVTVQDDGPMPKRLLAAGASGYVIKAGPPEELIAAIRTVAKGKRYVASELAQQLALQSISGESSPFDSLSERELETAMLLIQGHRMIDIGEQLKISAKTIATHKYRLFEKLGVKDVVSLARLAGQYGLCDPSLILVKDAPSRRSNSAKQSNDKAGKAGKS